MTGVPGLNIPRSAVYFQEPPPPRKWALVPLEDFEDLHFTKEI